LLKGGSGNGMTALGEAVAAAIGARIISIDGRDGLGSAPPESWRSEDVVVIAHLDGLEPAEQVAVIGAGKLPAIVLAKCNPTPGRMPYPPDDDTRERFLVGGILGYPDRETALQIIEVARRGFDANDAEGIGLDELDRMRAAARAVVMPAEVDAFVVDAVEATRRHESVLIGGSVVALLDIVRVASAIAVSAGRTAASIADAEAAMVPVLAHRLVMTDGADPGTVIHRAIEEAQSTRV
ncbi:MAG TPA: hypothetical protein VMY34_01635, partial [Acidimicrobiales bacterium]|nr:hypothetical protein [Acidimicrobiales bacterium]